jgi:formylglycine-generating enzyme required for sulfatase activity
MFSLGDQRPMAFIPAGPFLMGASETDENAAPEERPQREVVVEAFWIDLYEVTHEEYALCVQVGDCNSPAELDSRGFSYEYAAAIRNSPVINVSWDNAAGYCAWAGKRLPTEAEWEKAARGTDARLYPWGNDPDAFHKAWYCNGCIYVPDHPEVYDDFSRPMEVGFFTDGVSPYGVFDMAGNVWEWVDGWFADGLRPARGGGWTSQSISLRVTAREGRDPTSTWVDVGFRCAMADDRSRLISEK